MTTEESEAAFGESPEPTPDEVAELLRGIPGADDRIAAAHKEIARGEGLDLDDI